MPKGRGRKGSKTPKRRLVTSIEHRAELTTVIPSQDEITTEEQTSPTLSTTRPSALDSNYTSHNYAMPYCLPYYFAGPFQSPTSTQGITLVLLHHPHKMIHLFILSESTSYQATSASAMVVRTGIKNLVLLMTFAFSIKNCEFTLLKDLVRLKEDSVMSITIAVLLVFNPRGLPFLLLQWLFLMT